MLLGINKKSVKYIIGGIFHFLFIFFFAIIGVILLKKKEWFDIDYKKILPIYCFVIFTKYINEYPHSEFTDILKDFKILFKGYLLLSNFD